MSSLNDATDVILAKPERTATWLTLADRFIGQYNEDRAGFVLPRAYAFLLPLIEHFADNPDAFLTYISGIRESFPRGSDAAKQVQALYRKVNGRLTQQARRDRAQRAIDQAITMYGDPPNYGTRQLWLSKREHSWGQRRLEFMARATNGKRTAMEDRADLLLEFWAKIDTEIAKGEGLPPWDE